MAELTGRLKVAFPEEFNGDWFLLFKNFANEFDFSLFSSLSDRNLIITGGGAFIFSDSGLSWNNDLFIKNFSISLLYRITPRTVLLNDGDGLFVLLDRGEPKPNEGIRDAQTVVRNFIQISPGIKLDDFVLLCARFGNKLIFRNGRVMNLGDSIDIFDGVLKDTSALILPVDDNLSSQIDGIGTLFSTSLPFAIPNISLYLNGQRLVLNEDFTIVNDHQVQTIDPFVIGDKLIANYMVVGSAVSNFVWDEDLSSQVNGITNVFTTAFNIRVPFLSVFRNGQRLITFDDFNFVINQPNKFQLSFTPAIGEKIVVQYMKVG